MGSEKWGVAPFFQEIFAFHHDGALSAALAPT